MSDDKKSDEIEKLEAEIKNLKAVNEAQKETFAAAVKVLVDKKDARVLNEIIILLKELDHQKDVRRVIRAAAVMFGLTV